jgi:hypothetical protein
MTSSDANKNESLKEGSQPVVISSSGRVAWIKANLQSPCFKVCLLLTAKAVSKRIIGRETTGEKHSDLVHGRGSKFPNMTMQLFARTGTPLVRLTVKMHIEGIALVPCCLQRRKYSSSEIKSKVSLVKRPLYSSL